MLHGNPTWSYYFRNLVPALRDRGPLHRARTTSAAGLSDKPQDPTTTHFEARVDDLTALLDHLGIRENITLVVHDWGGMIGMTWAARHLAPSSAS